MHFMSAITTTAAKTRRLFYNCQICVSHSSIRLTIICLRFQRKRWSQSHTKKRILRKFGTQPPEMAHIARLERGDGYGFHLASETGNQFIRKIDEKVSVIFDEKKSKMMIWNLVTRRTRRDSRWGQVDRSECELRDWPQPQRGRVIGSPVGEWGTELKMQRYKTLTFSFRSPWSLYNRRQIAIWRITSRCVCFGRERWADFCFTNSTTNRSRCTEKKTALALSSTRSGFARRPSTIWQRLRPVALLTRSALPMTIVWLRNDREIQEEMRFKVPTMMMRYRWVYAYRDI